MQKKYRISLGVIAVVLIANMLLLNTSAPQKEKATCCKKAAQECPDSKKAETPAEITLEQLSHQFISLPVFIN